MAKWDEKKLDELGKDLQTMSRDARLFKSDWGGAYKYVLGRLTACRLMSKQSLDRPDPPPNADAVEALARELWKAKHPKASRLLEEFKEEFCSMARYVLEHYGRRETVFECVHPRFCSAEFKGECRCHALRCSACGFTMPWPDGSDPLCCPHCGRKAVEGGVKGVYFDKDGCVHKERRVGERRQGLEMLCSCGGRNHYFDERGPIGFRYKPNRRTGKDRRKPHRKYKCFHCERPLDVYPEGIIKCTRDGLMICDFCFDPLALVGWDVL